MARIPLIERLPEIWTRLDRDKELQDYLDLWDEELDYIHDLIPIFLRVHSVDEIADQWLSFLADLVGHKWRDDKDHDWNRRRIRDSLRRWSYKGTWTSIEDLVYEHGGSWCDVVDQASKLWVWNRQGRLNRGDCVLVNSDYWHHGAYVLIVTDDIDLDSFLPDFASLRPAGTYWFIDRMAGLPDVVFETVVDRVYEIGSLCSREPFGCFNLDLWLTFVGALQCMVDIAATSGGAAIMGTLTVNSVIRVSREDITVDQGVPGNLLTLEASLLQDPAEIEEGVI